MKMGWMIGRTAALSNPEAARRKAIEKLRALAELDDPESVVVPILLDALLREVTIVEKSKEWAKA